LTPLFTLPPEVDVVDDLRVAARAAVAGDVLREVVLADAVHRELAGDPVEVGKALSAGLGQQHQEGQGGGRRGHAFRSYELWMAQAYHRASVHQGERRSIGFFEGPPGVLPRRRTGKSGGVVQAFFNGGHISAAVVIVLGV
jgi:hypothetical protein